MTSARFRQLGIRENPVSIFVITNPMEGIHDRMPILLRKEDEAAWLDP
jgi:hypothetical protein